MLKVADRRTDGRTDAPDDDNRHPPKFWLRPKKYDFVADDWGMGTVAVVCLNLEKNAPSCTWSRLKAHN